MPLPWRFVRRHSCISFKSTISPSNQSPPALIHKINHRLTEPVGDGEADASGSGGDGLDQERDESNLTMVLTVPVGDDGVDRQRWPG